MNAHPFLFLVLLCPLAMIWILRLTMLRFHTKAAPKLKTPRPLKSKTPEDCPFCRAEKDRGTALYRLKTSSTSVALILALMADGVDVSALERVFGIREGTLRTWLTLVGRQAGKVHRHFFHHLILHHLQLDELWTQVRQGSRVVWVWTVVEASSKLVPVVKLVPRSMDLAYAVVHDLCQMLQPGCIPIFTSDGLKLYSYALTAHFGCWQLPEGTRKLVGEISSAFLYAQLKKIHSRRCVVRVERRMLCGELEYLKDGLQAWG
jgi:hypothetical protein